MTGKRRRLALAILNTPTATYFLPLTLLRFALGTFFFASGFNKVFIESNKAAMLETMMDAGIWWPHLMAPWVAGCEMVFGVLLAAGLLARASAGVLCVISVVAMATVGIQQIPSGQSVLGWYSWLWYLPEPWYVLASIAVMVQGGGPFSMDTWGRSLACGRKSG